MTYKPGSVRPCGRDDHSSWPFIAERLTQPTRTVWGGNALSGFPKGPPGAPFLFGFAPGEACLATDVTTGAVRSYRTLSPLPYRPEGHARRFAFCGAISGVTPGGRYPPPYCRGARTFLERSCERPATARSSGIDLFALETPRDQYQMIFSWRSSAARASRAVALASRYAFGAPSPHQALSGRNAPTARTSQPRIVSPPPRGANI